MTCRATGCTTAADHHYLVPHGDGWKGEGYSPEDGRYYKAHLRIAGNKLTMKGCVAVFCRTVTWTRIV